MYIDLPCSPDCESCTLVKDGYYIVGTVCVVAGLIMLLAYIKPIVQRLERYPKQMWRLNSDK